MSITNFKRRLTAILVFAVLAAGVVPSLASAAGGNGLRVSPVRSPADFTITAGQTKTLDITVTNITTTAADLQAIVNDFTANSDESGQPALVLDPTQAAPKHSLKSYVKPIPNFSLQPGESKVIKVSITIPADAAGGGYFGAVRFAPVGSGDASKNVSLAGSVGSLILVRVPGDIVDKLSIVSFDVRKNDSPRSFFTSNKHITAVVRFKNEGNVQEQPFGKVLLKDRSGKILGEYEVNSIDPRGNVLPESIRKFNVDLTKVGSFGKYSLEGNFGYGSKGQLLSASTSFYVVPLALIVGFVALVLLIAFLVFVLPRLIRAYNQRILRRAGRR